MEQRTEPMIRTVDLDTGRATAFQAEVADKVVIVDSLELGAEARVVTRRRPPVGSAEVEALGEETDPGATLRR